MIHGIAVLDYGPQSVTVFSSDRMTDHGTWSGAYGREHALELLGKNGWYPAAGAEWVVSVNDNGRVIDVVTES